MAGYHHPRGRAGSIPFSSYNTDYTRAFSDWPTGCWLLDGKVCRSLDTAETRLKVEVEVVAEYGKLTIGGIEVPVVDIKWVDYWKFHEKR